MHGERSNLSRAARCTAAGSPQVVRKMTENDQRLSPDPGGIRAGQRRLATNDQRIPTERAYKETKKA